MNSHLKEIMKKYIFSSGNKAFCCHKPKHLHFFTKNFLQKTVKHLTKCYFEVTNLIVLQTSDIPMGIDPAPFMANLYLSEHEFDVMGKLIKEDIARAKTFHEIYRFIDDHWALNDGGEFQKSFKEIYLKELVLKLEHSGSHTTFRNLNITISNGKISTKLYNKYDEFFFYCLYVKRP